MKLKKKQTIGLLAILLVLLTSVNAIDPISLHFDKVTSVLTYLTDYVPYIGATGNVNISPYNLTTNSLILSGGGHIIDLGGIIYSASNLSPETTLYYDLGSGANRWLNLYVSNVNSESIDNLNNISTLGYFIGNGSQLTDISYTESDPLSLHLSQDNWDDGDNGYLIWDGDSLQFNDSRLETIYYNATSIKAIRGTVAGTINLTYHIDGLFDLVTLNLTEVAGAEGLDVRINFTDGIDVFTTGLIRYKTSSLAGTSPIIQLWDYDDGVWDEHYTLGETLVFSTITKGIYDWSRHVQDGVVQMRIYKAANGNTGNHYYIDWMAITKGYGTPSGREVDPYSWHKDIDYHGNYTTTGNVTADYYFGNGSQLTGIDGAFLWNETDDYLYPSGTNKSLGLGTATPNNKIQVIGLINFDDTNQNIHLGTNAGADFTGTIQYNTLIGEDAGRYMAHTTGNTGWTNLYIGYQAGMGANDGTNTGYYNVGMGYQTLEVVTTGSQNVGIGTGALRYCNIANGNVAIGQGSLGGASIAGATQNVGIGVSTLSSLIGGDSNIAIGANALSATTSQSQNTAIGAEAGRSNTGNYNVLLGYRAGKLQTSGQGNVQIGRLTGYYNTLGDYNVKIGDQSGQGASDTYNFYNTFIGRQSGYLISSGSSNIFLGHLAGSTQTTNSNLLIVDNQQRANATTEATNAILYGTMAASPADQTLRINAGVSLGSNTLDGLTSGDINASTIYYDTLTAKSPMFMCSDNWCSVSFPQYQKTLWIDKNEDWTVNDIIFNDNHYTKAEFWNTICQTNEQTKNICLRLNDKLTRLQDKYTCLNNGYNWDGECYEIITTTNTVTYSDAVDEIPIYNTTQTEYPCTELNDKLEVVDSTCYNSENTDEIIDYTYQFKDGCGWDNGYYCTTSQRITL